MQKYFCRPLPSAAGPAYYYEIYVGGNNRARALVPGERYATLDQGSERGQSKKSRAILYNLGQGKFEFHFFWSTQLIELKMQNFLGLYNLSEMFLLKQILCRKSSPE